jgi:hypothetical protein
MRRRSNWTAKTMGFDPVRHGNPGLPCLTISRSVNAVIAGSDVLRASAMAAAPIRADWEGKGGDEGVGRTRSHRLFSSAVAGLSSHGRCDYARLDGHPGRRSVRTGSRKYFRRASSDRGEDAVDSTKRMSAATTPAAAGNPRRR